MEFEITWNIPNKPKVTTGTLENISTGTKFYPSQIFQGSKPGYVFTTRSSGTGYYLQ